MSLLNSLSTKPVEVSELQQRAQKLQKQADVNVSNLFTGKQSDHSRYIRATVASAEAVRSAMANRMNAMVSLLQVQIDYESNNQVGELNLSYSTRARIGARAARLLSFDEDRMLQRDHDASAEKDRNAAREAEGRIDISVIKDAVEAQKVASQQAHVPSSVRSSGSGAKAGAKVQAKVSVRV